MIGNQQRFLQNMGLKEVREKKLYFWKKLYINPDLKNK